MYTKANIACISKKKFLRYRICMYVLYSTCMYDYDLHTQYKHIQFLSDTLYLRVDIKRQMLRILELKFYLNYDH